MSFERALAFLVAVSFSLALHGCTSSDKPPAKTSTTSSVPPDSLAGKIEPVKRDAPGGPSHAAVPSMVDAAQLEEASRAGISRKDGEQFALLFASALVDTREGTGHNELDGYLAEDTSPTTVAAMSDLTGLLDAHLVPGSRSWLRSTGSGKTSAELAVEIIQLSINPTISTLDEPDGFTSWDAIRLDISHDGKQWQVTALNYEIASSSRAIRPSAMRHMFDGGKGWRRVPVS